MSITVSW